MRERRAQPSTAEGLCAEHGASRCVPTTTMLLSLWVERQRGIMPLLLHGARPSVELQESCWSVLCPGIDCWPSERSYAMFFIIIIRLRSCEMMWCMANKDLCAPIVVSPDWMTCLAGSGCGVPDLVLRVTMTTVGLPFATTTQTRTLAALLPAASR